MKNNKTATSEKKMIKIGQIEQTKKVTMTFITKMLIRIRTVIKIKLKLI